MKFKFERIVKSPLLGGACYIFRRDVLCKVGGFIEKYIYGSEDLALSLRVLKNGYKLIWYKNVNFFHYPRGTIIEYFKEQFKWGLGSSIFFSEIDKQSKKMISIRSYYKVIFPLISIYLAFKFRNPFHILLLNIGQLGWFTGFTLGKLRNL